MVDGSGVGGGLGRDCWFGCVRGWDNGDVQCMIVRVQITPFNLEIQSILKQFPKYVFASLVTIACTPE